MVIAELDAPDTYAAELPEVASPSQTNPLGPLYLVLSYLFLFFFIVCVMGIMIPLLQVLTSSQSGPIRTTANIGPIVIEVIFGAIFFQIARMLRKSREREVGFIDCL